MATRNSWKALLVTLAGAGLFIIGRHIALPGIGFSPLERGLGAEWLPDAIRLGLPLGSVLDVGAGWLLLFWLLSALRRRDTATRDPGDGHRARTMVLFVAYLVACAATFWLMAVGLETGPGGVEPVSEPGLRVELVAVLAQTGGAAVLWWVAAGMTRYGVGYGVLALFAAQELVVGVGLSHGVVNDVANRFVSPGDALVPLLSTLPIMVSLLFLAVRRLEWPASIVGGLQLLSAFDFFALPYVAGFLTTTFTGLLPPGERAAVFGVSGPIVATTVAALLAWRFWHQSVPRRRTLLLAAAVGVPCATLGAITFAVAIVSGGRIPFLEPGPYTGGGCFDVRLVSSSSTPQGDAARLVRRLRAMRVHSDLLAQEAGALRMRLSGVRDPHEVFEDLGRPGRLAFRVVAADQGPLQPTSDESEIPGVECQKRGPGEQPCTPVTLEPPAVTERDVVRAEVAWSRDRRQPLVALELSKRAARRLSEVTENNVQRHLAVTLDGELQSRSLILEPMTGRKAQLNLGRGETAESSSIQAKALVASLATGPLGADWRVDSTSSCPRP